MFFGKTLAAPGDVNGDGLADMLIGSEEETVFLVHGSPDIEGTWVTAEDFGPTFRTGVSDHSWVAAGAGDIDADGYVDLLIGAPWAVGLGGSWTVEGHVYVYKGTGR